MLSMGSLGKSWNKENKASDQSALQISLIDLDSYQIKPNPPPDEAILIYASRVVRRTNIFIKYRVQKWPGGMSLLTLQRDKMRKVKEVSFLLCNIFLFFSTKIPSFISKFQVQF